MSFRTCKRWAKKRASEKTYTLYTANHVGRISFLLALSHNPAALVRNDTLGKSVMGRHSKHDSLRNIRERKYIFRTFYCMMRKSAGICRDAKETMDLFNL